MVWAVGNRSWAGGEALPLGACVFAVFMFFGAGCFQVAQPLDLGLQRTGDYPHLTKFQHTNSKKHGLAEGSPVTVSRLCATTQAFSSGWCRPGCHGIESSNHLEQLFVDAALAKPVELGTEIREQLANVAVGALHSGKATRVFAGQ